MSAAESPSSSPSRCADPALSPEGRADVIWCNRRWPIVDGIPYLRVGRESLADAALARLDAGDREGALVLLLADQDDWWDGPAPEPQNLRRLATDPGTLTLRDAIALLGLRRVGDYFLHRWSDPTYLAGLALMEAHWTTPATALELAAGIGHYARALARQGVQVTATDVVFAKLWLARHFVVPASVQLVCFDAAHPWPTLPGPFDLSLCHDAFYFLGPKPAILASLRAQLTPGGTLAMAHIHNRDWPNLSSAAAITLAELTALFPNAVTYDDAELTRALAETRAPRPSTDLADAEAFAITEGPVETPRPLTGGLTLPAGPLRPNPLLTAIGPAWPSERYAAEYAPRATWLDPAADPARSRRLVDLPARW